MRRRKATTMQINVRLDTAVVDQLEAHAKINRVSFAEEARQRLIDSLNPKPMPSLNEFRVYFTERLRDVIETNARKTVETATRIEDDWAVLQQVDAELAGSYSRVERLLSHRVSDPEVRNLLRGAPILPDETKVKA